MNITRLLGGKKVREAMSNGHVLLLRLEDGGEVEIGWADDNGKILKGQPVLLGTGMRLVARGAQELINLPGAARW